MEITIPTMHTCGKHFYIGCNDLTIKQTDGYLGALKAYEHLKVAYHGTAMDNILPGLKDGIEPGMSHFARLIGVYCDGEERHSSVWHYMTHQNLDPENPNHFYAAQWELLVDRSHGVGKSCNKQWVQPKDSVIQVAVIIHVFNMLDVFTKIPFGGNYSGWFRVYHPCLKKLGLTAAA